MSFRKHTKSKGECQPQTSYCTRGTYPLSFPQDLRRPHELSNCPTTRGRAEINAPTRRLFSWLILAICMLFAGPWSCIQPGGAKKTRWAPGAQEPGSAPSRLGFRTQQVGSILRALSNIPVVIKLYHRSMKQQTCVSDAGFSGQAGGPIRTSMITEHAQNKLFQKGQDLGFDPHLMWFLGHLPHELFINFSSARACVDGDKL